MRLRTFVITRSTRMIAIPPYLLAWEKKRPKLAPAVAPYFRKQRAEWQNALADFRNYQEHKDDRDSTVFAGMGEETAKAGACSSAVFPEAARGMAECACGLSQLPGAQG